MVPTSADVVIIGGGIIGTATAYHLAKAGMKSIVVVERSYLASGSTGRCGAGIRAQWGTEMNCKLASDSIGKFEMLAQELDYPDGIEFKQGGYLILAYTDSQWEQMKKNVELQRSLGIEAELLSPTQAQDKVEHLSIDGVVGATFAPRDGHVNPFKAVDAYARAARRLGVTVCTDTEVTAIYTDEGRISSVQTTKGRIKTGKVMNAAGPYSQIVAKMVGIELPTYSERHQILVTEPVDHIQGPMVVSFHHGLYCQQVPNGNFLVGLGENEPKSYDISSSWEFLLHAARVVRQVLPPLTDLRVIRQWAGLYNVSPDRQPILGSVRDVDGYYMAVGFSGHGFMIAPTVAEMMAAQITGTDMRIDVSRLNLERFKRGDLIKEPSVV